MKTVFILFFEVIFSIELMATGQVEMLDKNISLTKISEKTYLLQSSYSCNGRLDCNHLLIVDDKEVVLVNTPATDSLTSIMLNCIIKKFNKKVNRVIVSHFHDDSSGGLKEVSRRGITSYGLDKTKDLLQPIGKNIDVAFKDSLKIPLQTLTLELFYFGPGHSVDNIVVWIPDDKVLFGGCLVKSLKAQDKGNIKDADLKAWTETVQKVKDRCKDAQFVIPGHSEYGDAALLDHTIKLVKE
jgi:metallo-beta-lactamase class B